MRLVDEAGNEIKLYPSDYYYLRDGNGRLWLVGTVTNEGDLLIHSPPLELAQADAAPARRV